MSTKYATLPTSWSNKRKAERLRADAYASLTRMLSRAVAETSVNFSIYSALRTTAEQHALFVANYRDTGKTYPNGDRPRKYRGTYWARRPGSVAVAVPGSPRANHEGGLAVDIHPGAIQNWIKRNGLRFGWSWAEGKRNNEDWHFRYFPEKDRYKSEGLLDHAAVQRAVGAAVDGKIGTGTVAKIKAKQRELGLEVDGKVGPATKKALGISGKAEAAPAPSVPATPSGGASAPVPAPQPVPSELTIEQAGPARNAYAGRTYDGVDYSIRHVTIHWWGTPSGQTFEGIRDYLIDNDRQVSAHYVVSGERVAQILPEERGAWGNGNRRANLEGIVVECDPNRVEETVPTLIALLSDIFRRRGEIDVYPHDHWTSTECPGEYRQHLPAIVAAAKSGATTIVTTPPSSSAPATGGGLPTGKDLLMKLADVPDFPLLRTPGHLCYYGDASGPIESVSGKSENSLNPGEIYTRDGLTRSRGIETAQRQLVARGYSVDVDGRWGAQMDNAIDNVQRLAGFDRDRKLGPVTWYALWLLPVK